MLVETIWETIYDFMCCRVNAHCISWQELNAGNKLNFELVLTELSYNWNYDVVVKIIPCRPKSSRFSFFLQLFIFFHG
jgi:hypothetical protein